MAIRSGFFDDATYYASDFATSMAGILTNGVLADDLTTLQVLAAGNMTVAILAGYCWIKGQYGYNDSTMTLPISTADGTLNRIDRVITRLNKTEKKVEILVLKGALAATPTAPALIRDGTYFDLCLANILVNKGTTIITQAMITDTRADSSLCGPVLARSADLLALEGKADKARIIDGTLKTNADRLLDKTINAISPTEGQVHKLINGVWTPSLSLSQKFSGTFATTTSGGAMTVSMAMPFLPVRFLLCFGNIIVSDLWVVMTPFADRLIYTENVTCHNVGANPVISTFYRYIYASFDGTTLTLKKEDSVPTSGYTNINPVLASSTIHNRSVYYELIR